MPEQPFQALAPDHLKAVLDLEANDELDDDGVAQLANWRAQGLIPAKAAPTIPAPPTAQGLGKRIGQATWDYATDPTRVGPDVGQAVGGLTGLVTRIPGAPVILGGVGRAGGKYVGEAIHQGTFTPKVSTSDYGTEALSGSVGELVGKIPSTFIKALKTPMTKMGAETYDILGDKASIPDLVDSTGWNFVRNMAQESYLGRSSSIARETTTGNKLLGAVEDVATHNPSYAGPIPTPPLTKGAAGRAVKLPLKTNYDTNIAAASAEYDPWMKSFGQIPTETDANGNVVATVADYHAARSQALAEGRTAAAANDKDAKRLANEEAKRLYGKIQASINDPAAMTEYDRIGKNYGLVTEKYDNPTVHNLKAARNMPEEKVMDALHTRKLTTEAPFRDQETLKPLGRDVPKDMTISESDAVSRVKEALGPDAAHEMRSNSIFTLAKDATTKTEAGEEILDGKAFAQMINEDKIPKETQQILWGAKSSDNLQKIARVTEHVQRARTGSGGLWIVMRQPAAALTLGGALVGTGHSAAGLTSAGVIIVAPWVFSKIIDSPAATRLFVQTIQAATPQMKAQFMKQLTAEVAQRVTAGATSHGLSATINPKKEPTMESEGTIPLPPQR